MIKHNEAVVTAIYKYDTFLVKIILNLVIHILSIKSLRSSGNTQKHTQTQNTQDDYCNSPPMIGINNNTCNL